MKVDPELLKELIRRNEARDHLLDFARYTHPQWQDGEHHKRICDALEALARRDICKLMIEAPPRHTKTELASRRFPAWYLGHHPDQQIIVATYSDELARDNGLDVLNIVRDPVYKHIFPDIELSADAQASGRWRTSKGGIYFATGIGGAVTGRGFDCIAAGQPTLTKRGIIPIESVCIGDMVLTHKLRWRRVLATATKGVRPIIRLHGFGFDLKCTPCHGIFDGERWNHAEDSQTVATVSMQRKNVRAANQKTSGFVEALMRAREGVRMWRHNRNMCAPHRPEPKAQRAWESSCDLPGMSYAVPQISQCGVERVFDIQVEEDGSFVAGGVVCHNCGILDDPLKSREEADSPRVNEVLWRWYWGTFDTRAMPGAVRLIMTTRWKENDICGRLLELEGKEWTVIELPAIANEGTDHESALWPGRYGLEYMQTKRDDLRRAGRGREWNAQYQQRPTAEEGTYVLRSWFAERWKELPDPAHIYMASDLAVTEPREGADPDSTEHGVFATGTDGRLYVVDWWNGQATAEKWIESLLFLVKKWGPLAWFGEGGVIRRAIEPLLDRICMEKKTYVNAQWVTPIADKATRGRAFQAWASMGRVVFPQTAWAERIIDQCCDFPGGKHDDAFDVLATMCGVIDNAHPAVQPTTAKPQRDREWVSASQPKTESWKTK